MQSTSRVGVERHEFDDGVIVGHGGLFPGYTTGMGLRRDSDYIVVALSNTYGYFDQFDPVNDGLLALESIAAP